MMTDESIKRLISLVFQQGYLQGAMQSGAGRDFEAREALRATARAEAERMSSEIMIEVNKDPEWAE